MDTSALISGWLSLFSLLAMLCGVLYFLLLYRRTMRQYKLQMDQTVLEMRRQNDALETLIRQHDKRLVELEH